MSAAAARARGSGIFFSRPKTAQRPVNHAARGARGVAAAKTGPPLAPVRFRPARRVRPTGDQRRDAPIAGMVSGSRAPDRRTWRGGADAPTMPSAAQRASPRQHVQHKHLICHLFSGAACGVRTVGAILCAGPQPRNRTGLRLTRPAPRDDRHHRDAEAAPARAAGPARRSPAPRRRGSPQPTRPAPRDDRRRVARHSCRRPPAHRPRHPRIRPS